MKQKKRHPLGGYALMSGIVSYLAGSILIGIFAGRWLDKQLHTEPIFLIIGVLVGLAAGVAATLKLVQDYFSGE